MLSDPGNLSEVGTMAARLTGIGTIEETQPLLGPLLKSESEKEKCPGSLLLCNLHLVLPSGPIQLEYSQLRQLATLTAQTYRIEPGKHKSGSEGKEAQNWPMFVLIQVWLLTH